MLNNEEDILKPAVLRLVHSERFYAELVFQMRRSTSTEVDTLGVYVTDKINLVVNPNFWKNHTVEEQVEFLKHECHHILLNHIPRFKEIDAGVYEKKESDNVEDILEKMEKTSELNKAADYATNEFLPNLPKKVGIYDKEGKQIVNEQDPSGKFPLLFVEDLIKDHPDIQRKKSLEYYHQVLKEKKDKGGKNSQKNNSNTKNNSGNNPESLLDDHNIWSKSSGSSEQIAQKIKNSINKAVENCHPSDIPNNLKEVLKDLNKQAKDWKADLRRFINRNISNEQESSKKVRNRRYGFVYPGYRSKTKAEICIAIDTSGSMSTEQLNQIWAEINKIHKTVEIDITIVECDTKINKTYKFDPKIKPVMHFRGGTLFKPVFDYCAQNDVEGLIYFTDGYNGDTNSISKPKYPILWALNENCKKPYEWGFETVVKIKN